MDEKVIIHFPVFPRVIGLVCVALGLLGLGGDIYTFTQPAMVAAAPAWVHIVGVLVDILFLAGGIGIILRKKSLYLLEMANCFICAVYSVISMRLLDWDEMIRVRGYELPPEAVSAGILIGKAMVVLIGVIVPIAFLVVLAFYYRRISRDVWR